MILGADLRQRSLACREVIDERRTFFTDVRLHAHGEQQLQQRIAIFFGIGDITEIELCRHFAQLGFICRERIDLQIALEGLLIREAFRGLALEHLLQ